jgi:membrane protease YdiL (CAAX protease family)
MHTPPPAPLQSTRWFWSACAFEGFLAVLALGLAPALSLPLAGNLHWSGRDAILGLTATLPLLALLALLLRVRWPWMREIIGFLDRAVRPILGRWSLVQVAVLSALAGVGEELLFRAVIQEGCSRLTSVWLALLIASLLFGLVHWITRGYALLAAGIGLYLGWLWIHSGNLLTPIVTHATYDFVALVYFLRFRAEGSV